jgi:ATP synthase protein I
MSQPPSPGRLPQGSGDPWAAFGYLVAGVGFYGLLGWGLGVWLHASYLTPIGIIVGAVLGLALVYYQFGRAPGNDEDDDSPNTSS